jgi:uncharacterized RDD family membrane protein YckC
MLPRSTWSPGTDRFGYFAAARKGSNGQGRSFLTERVANANEHSRTAMKVQIQTAQNVDIEYEIASVGSRIGARLIDALVIVGYYIVLILVFSLFANENIFRSLESAGGMGMALLYILLLFPPFFYHLVCEIFMDGQSFGKKAVQIKVVRLDGSQPTIGNYILRWLIGLFETNLFSGAPALITILVNGKGQRLGDLAAGTTVVKLKPPVTLEQTIYARVQEDYAPTFPTVTNLSDEDVAIITEVLSSHEQLGNPVVVGTLVRKVKEVLGVESDLPATKLLRTVVKDYNYYTGKG